MGDDGARVFARLFAVSEALPPDFRERSRGRLGVYWASRARLLAVLRARSVLPLGDSNRSRDLAFPATPERMQPVLIRRNNDLAAAVEHCPLGEPLASK
jgi:hypothetical protein